MSEGWTRAEARYHEHWCEGLGYRTGGVPVCGGKAKRAPVGTLQLCQRCERRTPEQREIARARELRLR